MLTTKDTGPKFAVDKASVGCVPGSEGGVNRRQDEDELKVPGLSVGEHSQRTEGTIHHVQDWPPKWFNSYVVGKFCCGGIPARLERAPKVVAFSLSIIATEYISHTSKRVSGCNNGVACVASQLRSDSRNDACRNRVPAEDVGVNNDL